jgi:hypothetical protein
LELTCLRDMDSENVDQQRSSRFGLHERTDGGRMEGRVGYGRRPERDGVEWMAEA